MISHLAKGRLDSQKWMFFWKTSEGGAGGGVISDPTNFIADFFGFKMVYFVRKFWKQCPKRGERGGVISNPKNVIANLRKLTHIYKLSRKKRNEDFQNGGGGVKGCLDFFQKNINFGATGCP